MSWKNALITIVYTAFSGAMGALVVGGVAPEIFADSRKLWMILGLSAVKDVWLLMSNSGFKKELGIFMINGKTEEK